MGTNRIVIIIFCVLFILPFVLAVPPTFTEISAVDQTLNIAYPKFTYYPLATAIDLHFHVFNSTGFPLNTSDTACLIHIYNSEGHHIAEDNLTQDDNGVDYTFIVNSSLLTEPGDYTYIVQCVQEDGEAGFVSTGFQATYRGKEPRKDIYTILIMYAILTMFWFFIGIKNSNTANPDATRIDYVISTVGFSLGLIMLLTGVAAVLLYYVYGDVTILLNVTFIANTIILFFGGLLFLWRQYQHMAHIDPKERKWDKGKW